MKVSSYQTKPCAAYQLSSIDKAIKLAWIEGGMSVASWHGKNPRNLYMVSPANLEVPSFAHPIVTVSNSGIECVVIDCRGTVRLDRNGEIKIINHAEYDFNVLRGLFNIHAVENGLEDLANLGDFSCTVFARFLGENITRRLAFNPEEQMLITMVSAFYFMCLSRPAGEIDERELQRMVVKVARCTRLNVEWIFDHCSEITHMDSIQDYVDVLKKVVVNTRMNNMSVALLYGIVGGGWFGLNSREVVAVALEHLPTWTAIVHTAINDRSFRKSGISQVVQQVDRNGLGKDFTINSSRLLQVILNV